jgi:membrane associated rhomboid family serine protease
MNSTEKKHLLSSLAIPFLFLLIMWIVKIIEYNFKLSFAHFGVFPQSLSGLKGILLSPFIHKDFTHLINNSYPILILGGILFSVYRKIALQLFVWLFFIAGFWLWIIGRPSFHIGASGIIYALASFLLISGIVQKNPRLSAISMLVIFL